MRPKFKIYKTSKIHKTKANKNSLLSPLGGHLYSQRCVGGPLGECMEWSDWLRHTAHVSCKLFQLSHPALSLARDPYKYFIILVFCFYGEAPRPVSPTLDLEAIYHP